MSTRILFFAGLLAALVIIASCFMPWAYYADLNQYFTGFYSYKNYYGKPGKFISWLAGLAFLLMLVPKVWAKRINLFLTALLLGYAIKNYIAFSSCYNAYCPEIKPGLYLMLSSAIVLMIASVFPDLKIEKKA